MIKQIIKSAFVSIFLGIFFLILNACSGSSLSDAVNKQSSFTYELSENGCSTGEKTFSTNDAMCAALRDDSLNHFCAQNLRYQKFKSDCPGKTW